jgi:hypothetical protein
MLLNIKYIITAVSAIKEIIKIISEILALETFILLFSNLAISHPLFSFY